MIILPKPNKPDGEPCPNMTIRSCNFIVSFNFFLETLVVNTVQSLSEYISDRKSVDNKYTKYPI